MLRNHDDMQKKQQEADMLSEGILGEKELCRYLQPLP